MNIEMRVQGKTCEVFLIPIFEDNYVFAGRALAGATGFFAVDPGEPTKLLEFLAAKSAKLEAIICTHEHSDHIGGIPALMKKFPECKIYGPPSVQRFSKANAAQFQPPEVMNFSAAGISFQVLPWHGHTTDHYSYFVANEGFMFCGDTLFGLGCGRIVSGTYQQLFDSLQKIKELPDTTRIFCAHEYAFRNLSFIQQKYDQFPQAFVARENYSSGTLSSLDEHLKEKTNREGATVPLDLAFERKHNPFLRAQDFMEFEAIRKLRNQF